MRRCLPLLLLLSAACAQATDDRGALLQRLLLEDQRLFLAREPARVEEKFARMAGRPYDFFRGSLTVWVWDVTTPGAPGDARSALPESLVLLGLGDPHPENLGTYRLGDGRIVLAFNDFDAAAYVPVRLELRRLAVGFDLLSRELGLSDDVRRSTVRAVVEGWAAALHDPVALEPRPADRTGRIGADLARRARRDGSARALLEELAPEQGGLRRLAPRVATPGDGTRLLTPGEQALAGPASALALGAPLPPDALVRRLGAGVASLPNLRFYGLVTAATDSGEDDRLLELKEVRGAPALPLPAGVPLRPFLDDAERVVYAARLLQGAPVHDPLLAPASLGPISFVARERTDWQKGLSLDRLQSELAKQDLAAQDVIELAHAAGGLLAAAHLRSHGPDGRPVAEALRRLDGREALGAETVAFAEGYGAQLLEDHARFVALLADEGPRLGWSDP